ncbi:MAG: DUF465 domain-containing protein [Rhodobacteraceae bacterium]|nr:DUF465 domain-containing protein [Paracoccaceae bacterium]
MSNTPHTLHEEFPAEVEKISALKVANAHFARLLDEYDAVNDQVHRAEARVDAVTEDHEAELRRKRSHLKDEIARMLRAA